MHELSIVQSLIELCEKNAKEQNAKEVEIVKIKIGRLSGVEPHLLKTSFEAFKKGTICENSVLECKIQDVVVLCKECEFQGILEKNHFICPICKSPNLSVIDGEDLMLMQLQMI